LAWYPGSGNHSSQTKPSRNVRHEPFTPAIPRFVLERPGVLGAVLAVSGIAASITLIKAMPGWPAWMIFPSMALAVLALAATVVGSVILVVLALQPIIAAKDDLDWDDEPLASMGIPLPLQRKCEALGYWTCEALSESIDRGLFPWNDLNYDERQQVHRAIQFWRTTTPTGG
jgi:hypothetical protein